MPAYGRRAGEEPVQWDDNELPPGVRRIVQLHDMYLLIETDTGMRLVDQHALHEKAIFLCLDPSATDVERAGRQELLTPITVDVGAVEMAEIEPLLPRLAEFGIDAEVFVPTTVAVRAFPSPLKKTSWPRFFQGLADIGDASKAVDDLREAIAHRASCRAAVKAGQELSPAEQRELVRLLYRLKAPNIVRMDARPRLISVGTNSNVVFSDSDSHSHEDAEFGRPLIKG